PAAATFGGMCHTTTRCLALFAVLALLTGCTARGTSPTSPSTTRNPTMHEFALLFRPTRALTPDELPRRNAAAREWPIALHRDGLLRGASPLEDEGFSVTSASVAPIARDGAVASVLIIQAADLDGALALAKGHPGLAFGTQIEVRPVKAVAPPPR